MATSTTRAGVPRDITPGRPLTGLQAEAERRDWDSLSLMANVNVAVIMKQLSLVQQAVATATYTTLYEVPTGLVNGVNTTFALSSVPIGTIGAQPYLNGLALTASEYTLSGSSLILTTPPSAGDTVSIEYPVGGTAPSAPRPFLNGLRMLPPEYSYTGLTVTPTVAPSAGDTLQVETPSAKTAVQRPFVNGLHLFPSEYTATSAGVAITGGFTSADNLVIAPVY